MAKTTASTTKASIDRATQIEDLSHEISFANKINTQPSAGKKKQIKSTDQISEQKNTRVIKRKKNTRLAKTTNARIEQKAISNQQLNFDKFPDRMQRVLEILKEKQVIDLVVLSVGKLVGYTDYFLIGTGRSQPHVDAMTDAVLDALKVKGARGLPVEKDPASTWVLIDCGEFILHLFQPEARKYYALEDLWSDAPQLQLAI